MTARAANWRCCAMLSATSFRAAILEGGSVRREVVRGGMLSRGLEGAVCWAAGCGWEVRGEEGVSIEDIVAREEVVRRGGRVWEDEASRRGVDVVELRVEGGRTRLLRRKVKKAAFGG